eukprot:PhM_4_TR12613/c0_g1_i1/m.84485
MGIETWDVFPRSLLEQMEHGVPLPCSDQNPRLKCQETRWARDYCISVGGNCEYKMEAHFNCLEQYYPKEKVDTLRKAFKPNGLDYPTSDVYHKYRHFYYHQALQGKTGWEGAW